MLSCFPSHLSRLEATERKNTVKGAGPGRQRDGLWARPVSRHLFETFLLPCVSTGPVYDSQVTHVYSRVRFRMSSFSLAFSFWCWGPEGSRSQGAELLKSQLRLPLCGGVSDSRIEPFLGTLLYFCSRAGCPMPRLLTTNRTSGRAYWFPPGFQTPLHISFGIPSPASKGNTWSPFCFAVTAGPSEALQGEFLWGGGEPGLTLQPWPRAHPAAALQKVN